MKSIRKRTSRETIVSALFLLLVAAISAIAGVDWIAKSTKTAFVDSWNPMRRSFVTWEYDRRDYSNSNRIAVRSINSGSIECDLTSLSDTGRWGWSRDGGRLVGITGEDEIVLVEPTNPPTVVRRFSHNDKNTTIDRAFFDANDNLMLLRRISAVDDSEPKRFQRLELLNSEDQQMVSVDYGLDEFAYGWVTVDGKIMNVMVSPEPRQTGSTDFKLTDGQTGILRQYDASTGELLRQLPDTFSGEYYRSEFVYQHSPSKTLVFKTEDTSTPVAKIGPGAFSISADQLLTIDHEQGKIKVFEIPSGSSRTIDVVPFESVLVTSESELLFVSKAPCRIMRLNIKTGEVTTILELAKGLARSRWLAFVGFGCFWLLVLVGQRTRVSPHPFADMSVLLLVSNLVLMAWSVWGLKRFDVDHPITHAGFISIGAFATFGLIWASTVRSFWGTALPAGLLVGSAIVGMFLVWSQGNDYRVVEALVAGFLLIGFQISGLLVVRRFWGVPTRVSQLPVDKKRSSQLTLRQVFIATTTLAVFLTTLRFVNFEQFLQVQDFDVFILWLVGYVAIIALIAFAAYWSAFRLDKIWLSFGLYLATACVCAGWHFVLTRNWMVNLAWEPVRRYSLPIAIGLMVWVALRYCRTNGFRLINDNTATTSE